MNDSYRKILRSTSIIGGASLIAILIGLIRTKGVAVLLGPSGVGLVGLLNNLTGTAAVLAALGLNAAGTQQIAQAVGRAEPKSVDVVRRSLFWATFCLAFFGATAFWLLRGVIADDILGTPELEKEIGYLALAVGLNVVAGSQTALLNGLRRIGDLARLSILTSVFSTTFGLIILWLYGRQGLVPFLLASPFLNALFGGILALRLPRAESDGFSVLEMRGQIGILIRLGAAFMFASLAVILGQLAVRSIVQSKLGPAALGHFEAAWMISMTYVGFVLQAMSADYYPRLTAVIKDEEVAGQLINEQTEVALLLAAPIFLFMLGFAPFVINLLYSKEFVDAVELLRYQVLGDIFKVASWPVTYSVLARGDGRSFFAIEAISMIIFSSLVWLGLPYLGIQATGIGFFVMYVINLPIVFWFARRKMTLGWRHETKMIFAALLIAAGMVVAICKVNQLWGALIDVLLTLGFLGFAVARLGRGGNLSGPAGKFFNVMNRFLGHSR